REYLRLSLDLARTQAGFAPAMGLIAGVGTLVVLWAGGRAVVDGRLSLGALVAFNGYLAYLAGPTIGLGWTLSIVRRGLTSMQRLQEVIEAVARDLPGTVVAGALRPAWTEGGLIQVRPVSGMAIGAGAVRADCTEGGLIEVRAGSDMLAAAPGLRVSHLTFAYAGRPGVARGGAGVAGGPEAVGRLPDGLGAVVGGGGLTLGGGQRRGMARPRALTGRPPVLVLDDAFASVDTAKEEEILTNLRTALAGRTVLLMTHRLRAARAAHRIVVLDAGRVVEPGAHDDLVRAGRPCARRR